MYKGKSVIINWLRKKLKNLVVTVAGCYLIHLVLDTRKSVTNKEKEEVTKSLVTRIENLSDIKSKLSTISDHDPQLLDYIQRKLVPPAPSNTKLILAEEIHSGQVKYPLYVEHIDTSPVDCDIHIHPNLPIDIFSQIGQAEEVIQYFDGKTNGVFVEAGAWDGEYLSNTLLLEVSSQQYL